MTAENVWPATKTWRKAGYRRAPYINGASGRRSMRALAAATTCMCAAATPRATRWRAAGGMAGTSTNVAYVARKRYATGA